MDRDDLSPAEAGLVAAVEDGRVLEAGTAPGEGEGAARTGDPGYEIRAEVIRDILRGRLAADPDPRGVRVRGARIVGELDLDNVSAQVGLALMACRVAEPMSARDAVLPWLTLIGTHLPSLHADRCEITGSVLLRDAVVDGEGEPGAVRFVGARIDGQLSCSGARFTNPTGPALRVDGGRIDGGVFLRRGFRAQGMGPIAVLVLDSADIGAMVDFDDARVRNPDGPALDLDGATLRGLLLPEGALCASSDGGDDGDPEAWRADGSLRLDGCTYRQLIGGGAPPDT
ncbi:hypothetical protein ACFO4E_21335 [Nocardiopsis mangrovi]|uniref:Oxidoreductase n=1 Tax=Nocardiopsis mangrovi TaxID=1179818 RepID=A0ABV9E029_9ACTN